MSQNQNGISICFSSQNSSRKCFYWIGSLQLDLLSPELDGLDLEVDADRRDERVVEGVVGEAEQYARLADARVADEEQLEEQVVALFRHGGDSFCRQRRLQGGANLFKKWTRFWKMFKYE